MADNVIINITGIIYDENGIEVEEEQISSIYKGSYVLNDDTHYIKYEEPSPDNTEIVINTIKCNIDGVRLSRKGSSHYSMDLKKREKNDAKYVTPFGTFDISNKMHEYILSESNDKIGIVMDYDLFMDGGFVHRRFMRIEIKKEAE